MTLTTELGKVKVMWISRKPCPAVDCDSSDADMIINSTSLGLKEDDPLPLQLNKLREDTVIADIVMLPAETIERCQHHITELDACQRVLVRCIGTPSCLAQVAHAHGVPGGVERDVLL